MDAPIDERIYRRFFEELEALGEPGRLLAHELRRMRDDGTMTREAALIDLYDRLGAEHGGDGVPRHNDDPGRLQ